MAKAVTLDKKKFNEVLNSGKTVLVDFWAEWCGPCKMIAPTVEELAVEFDNKAVVGKVDVDSNPELSAQYGIRSIPALMIFKDGKLVDRMVGVQPKSVLKTKLEANL